MSKQVQDAYIVAATRTPIGRSRPRLLPQHPPRRSAGRGDAQTRWRKCRRSTRRRSKTRSSAAPSPKAEQGLNMARVGRGAGRAAEHRGRRHRQPLLRVGPHRGADGGRPHPRRRGRRDDRRRRREHECWCRWGQQAVVQRRRSSTSDENIGIAYGMGLTAEKVAQQWKVSREAQDEFALASHQKAIKAHAGRRVRRRDDADRGRSTARRISPAARRGGQNAHRQPRRRRRAPTPRSKRWPS